MNKIPRLFPIWFLPVLVLITLWVITCQGCRGGRSLGKGSAGTVIIPQTPQQINERNRPRLEPLPPPPIISPSIEPIAPQVELPPVKPTPTAPTQSSAKANPVVVNPKAAGELKPFTPTTSATPKLITPPSKNLPTDNKATTPEIVGPNEAAPTTEKESFNWVELLLNYLLFIIIAIFIWTIYDIIRNQGSPKRKTRAKKKKKAIKPKK